MGRKKLVIGLLFAAVFLALPLVAVAKTGFPVTGAAFTTVDEAADGTGHCQNGNPQVNCNLYSGKKYVWLNGGPTANGVGPNGIYFFAVLDPGGQPNPNDGNSANLSSYYDCYQNREFTVTNGEVSAYTPSVDPACFSSTQHSLSNNMVFPHDFDSGSNTTPHAHPDNMPPFLRLYPYKDTDNPGGVYIMALCYLGPSSSSLTYPVDPSSCKYDAFKAPGPDSTPPTCTLTAVIAGPPKQVQITVQDATAGLETVSAVATNATVSIPDFYAGWVTPLVVTATKTNQALGARVTLTLTDVAGNQTVCDPVESVRRVVRLHAGHTTARIALDATQGSVLVRNGSPGARTLVLVVNRARYQVASLRPGEVRRLNITASLHAGRTNRVLVRTVGSAGSADVTFSS
jgi:hypothetical protein